jgi:hypothetical protein
VNGCSETLRGHEQTEEVVEIKKANTRIYCHIYLPAPGYGHIEVIHGFA